MSLSKYERNNTIRTDIDFKMNGALNDPSGSVAFVDVIKSDATYLVQDAATSRDGIGEYHYYFKAEPTDPLGIYIIVWHGHHTLLGSYGYMEITQRDAVQIVDVDQS